ncbi:GGDEF domain-containing protein [Tahibacter amnicola]|uniref:diguanylate cyclase n=1 Tax=Tahibacter amnicola TaxID=2976241 RepID=A0ABY6BJX0_9GAMM|nr:GGDEF domain-containing protein [Tahibacter amnicola]UXI69688.1 GGDEF domain-containing protein [Tahibacter amnicola]
MLALHRSTLLGCAAALAGIFGLFVFSGSAKPPQAWTWIDIVGEGGTTLMCALWLVFLLDGRPRGRVTRLLAGGLAAVLLAAWTDCLDEFFQVDKLQRWDNLLEGTLMPVGVILLTAGLYFWREEQSALSRQLRKRERLFREHRAFDRVTQLADAEYLVQQIRLELSGQQATSGALVLFDIDDFHRINHTFGPSEGDRVLQAVAQVMLLNLRNADLLCRYAGDRFAVLMPGRDAAQALRHAARLARAIEGLTHHTCADDQAISFTVRYSASSIDGEPEALLGALNRAIEHPAHWATHAA